MRPILIEIQRDHVKPKHFWEMCAEACKAAGISMEFLGLDRYEEWRDAKEYRHGTTECFERKGPYFYYDHDSECGHTVELEFEFDNQRAGHGYFYVSTRIFEGVA